MKRFLWLIVLAFSACLAWSVPASAEEQIEYYDVYAWVMPDGELWVEERIHATAEGNEIRRGLTRDLVRDARNDQGVPPVVYSVDEVLRDEQPEPYALRQTENHLRIRTGVRGSSVKTGAHVWQISYRSLGPFRFSPADDTLQWDVTGGTWSLPIAATRVRIELPDGAVVQSAEVYASVASPSGVAASSARAARLVSHTGNMLVFESTRPLAPHESLTVVVVLAKGVVAPPTRQQLRLWRSSTGAGMALACIVLLWAVGFRFFTAVAVRRIEPRRGATTYLRVGPAPSAGPPQWSLPAELSALRVRILTQRALPSDHELLQLSLDELAAYDVVNACVHNGTAVLVPNAEHRADVPATLPSELRELADAVVAREQPIVLSDASDPWLQTRRRSLRDASDRWLRGDGLLWELGWTVEFGLTTTLIALFVHALREPSTHPLLALVLVASGLTLIFVHRRFVRRKRVAQAATRPATYVVTMVLAAAALVGTAGWLLWRGYDVALPFAAVLAVILHQSMKADRRALTLKGRRLMDAIEGLRAYFLLAPAERAALTHAPAMSSEHYATLLPYATALGLDASWTAAFQASPAGMQGMTNGGDPSRARLDEVRAAAAVNGDRAGVSDDQDASTLRRLWSRVQRTW